MPPAPWPAPLLDPTPEAAAARAWAVRVHEAAGQIDAVAETLRRAGREIGLQGPAGTALRHLVDGLCAEVHGLAAACGAAAARLLGRAR